MFCVSVLLTLVPLLNFNVLAAEAYVGNSRPWPSRDMNFRRPVALTPSPNPIYDFSKPLSQPVEVQPNQAPEEFTSTPAITHPIYEESNVHIPSDSRTLYRGRTLLQPDYQNHPAAPLSARQPALIAPYSDAEQPLAITSESIAVPEPPRTISVTETTPLNEVIVSHPPPVLISTSIPPRHFLLPVHTSPPTPLLQPARLQPYSEIITEPAKNEEHTNAGLTVEPSQPLIEESTPERSIVSPSSIPDTVPTAPISSISPTDYTTGKLEIIPEIAQPTIEDSDISRAGDEPDKNPPVATEDQQLTIQENEGTSEIFSSTEALNDIMVRQPASIRTTLMPELMPTHSPYRSLLPLQRGRHPDRPSLSVNSVPQLPLAKPLLPSRSVLLPRNTVLLEIPSTTGYPTPRVSPEIPPQITILPESPTTAAHPVSLVSPARQPLPSRSLLPPPTTVLPELPSSTRNPIPQAAPENPPPSFKSLTPPWVTILPGTYTPSADATPPMTTSKPPAWGRSLMPESRATTVAPTQLQDYQCNQTDAYHRMANDCDSYVECESNVAMLYSCPDGLHFNPRAVWPEYPCAYPSEVKCDENDIRRQPQPTEECPRQYGFFAMSGSDCSQYVMCQEGLATVMRCPPGLVFNIEFSTCDWQENVPSCNPDVFRGFTCPAPPPEDEDMPDLIYKYRYNDSCKEYVACQRGHPRLLSCDPGLSFDEESQVCIDTELVQNCGMRDRMVRYAK